MFHSCVVPYHFNSTVNCACGLSDWHSCEAFYSRQILTVALGLHITIILLDGLILMVKANIICGYLVNDVREKSPHGEGILCSSHS